MSKDAIISFKIDSDLKAKADAIFSALGMDLETAIMLFLKECIKTQSIPFVISKNCPNIETQKALAQAKQLTQNNETTYSVEEALKELKRWH